MNLFQVIINDEENLLVKTLDYDYTHAITLLNGNLFILHRNGVVVYNYNFTSIIYTYNISLISSDEENEYVSIVQCDDYDKYVLSLMKNNLYVFSSSGKYIFHHNHTLFSTYSTKAYFKHYSFLYYKYSSSNYLFLISFINNDQLITFIKFTINANGDFIIDDPKIYNANNVTSDSVDCKILYNYISNYDVFACFYIIDILNEYYAQKNKIISSLFKIKSDDFENINNTDLFDDLEFEKNNNYLIKSTFGTNKRSLYVHFISTGMNQAYFLIFDFDSFRITEKNYGIDCSKGEKLFYANFFKYVNHYVISCRKESANQISINQRISRNNKNNNRIKYSNCSEFRNYDIIFLPYIGKYYAITNFICIDSNTQIYSFPISLTSFIYEIPSFEENYISTTIPNTIHSIIQITNETIISTMIHTTIKTITIGK